MSALIRVFTVLMLLTAPAKLCAFSWSDLWSNKDRQGLKAFEKGDYKKAGEIFEDSQWKSVALYKEGRYKEAVEGFSKEGDPESLYNKATALAKMQQIDSAIKTYEEVLKQDPEHADAKYNLELLKQLKQDQEEDKQENQNDEQDKNQDSNPDGGEDQSDQNQDPSKENESDTKDQQDNGSGDQQQPEDSESRENGEDREEGDQNPEPPSKQNKEENTSENSEEEANTASAEPGDGDTPYDEREQAMEQRLRQVEDDPGGLLRRKFLRDHERMQRGRYR